MFFGTIIGLLIKNATIKTMKTIMGMKIRLFMIYISSNTLMKIALCQKAVVHNKPGRLVSLLNLLLLHDQILEHDQFHDQ